MEAKEQATALDTLAWSVGSYVVDAMAIFLGRNAPAYPSQPRSMNSTEDAPPGAKMTDADRFAAFAAEHNKRLRQRREGKHEKLSERAVIHDDFIRSGKSGGTGQRNCHGK